MRFQKESGSSTIVFQNCGQLETKKIIILMDMNIKVLWELNIIMFCYFENDNDKKII